VPRRSKSRSEVTTVRRAARRRESAPLDTRTVFLAPVEIDAIVQSAEGASRDPDACAPRSVDAAVGSQRMALDGTATPTVALAPVEIDALIRGAEALEGPADLDTMRTVENVRIARGSSSMPPATVDARGPRHPRETLRVDSIRSPGKPTPPSRKR
jgi:hypothetical protein